MVTLTSLLLAGSIVTGVFASPMPDLGNKLNKRDSTPNGQGTGSDGLFWSTWTNGGDDFTFTNNDDSSYTATWSGSGDIVCGKGFEVGSAQEITYSGTYDPDGGSFLSVYGWFTDPLIEYYILENYGTADPTWNTTFVGNVTTDGSVYAIHQTERIDAASIQGNTNFHQYWSIRQDKRTGGTINTGNHFAAWKAAGLTLGTFGYQILATEGISGTGSSSITVAAGGSSDTSSQSSAAPSSSTVAAVSPVAPPTTSSTKSIASTEVAPVTSSEAASSAIIPILSSKAATSAVSQATSSKAAPTVSTASHTKVFSSIAPLRPSSSDEAASSIHAASPIASTATGFAPHGTGAFSHHHHPHPHGTGMPFHHAHLPSPTTLSTAAAVSMVSPISAPVAPSAPAAPIPAGVDVTVTTEIITVTLGAPSPVAPVATKVPVMPQPPTAPSAVAGPGDDDDC